MKIDIIKGEAVHEFERVAKLIFFTYVICNFIGISIDSIDYYNHKLSILLSLNIFNLTVIAILITMLFLKKITFKIANPVFFYVLALNLIITDIYNLNHQIAEWQIIIFRDVFIYVISIIVAGIINGKKHVIVLTIIYLAFLTYAFIVSEQSYFTDNIVIIALCVSVFSVSIVFYLSTLSKTLLDISELQKAIFEKEIELLNKKNELENQKIEFLEESLTQKNKELITHELIKAQNIEFQKRIHSKICEIAKFDTEQIKAKLSGLISELSVFEKNNHWDEFHKCFEEVHSDFYTKLIRSFPGLSPAELKLASLIKLGLSSKDIASITQNTCESIHVARSRLRKKLNLDSSDNLVSFFNSI